MPWKLLVLEDDANLRKILCDVLRDEGYEVVGVENGEAAIQRASEEEFDLIVTDIRMDGVDGLQALERARGYQPELSSLVVSGYTSEAETLRALDLNVGAFLKKPFSLSDFLQRTRELLQQRRTQQERQRGLQRLRQSFWWALGAAHPSGQECGTLALALAQQLGLEPESVQRIRLAAWTAGQTAWPASAGEDALGLGPILALAREAAGPGPLSLEAQVVHLAGCLAQERPPEGELDARLQPFLASPPEPTALLEAQTRHEARLGLTGKSQQQRGLACLAATLEEHGDLSSAQAAYRRLSLDPELSVEIRLQALIGLSRVLWTQGDGEWYPVLQQCESVSRQLGPLAGAARRWEIATLLVRAGHPSASDYLARLEGELGDLRQGLPLAKARVAQASLGRAGEGLESAVQALLAPEHLGEVAREADWLVAALLEVAPRAPGLPASAWARLVCEFPSAALAWLQQYMDGPPTQGGSLRGVFPPQPARSEPLQHLIAVVDAGPERLPRAVLEALSAHPAAAGRAAAWDPGGAAPLHLRIRSLGELEIFVNGERVPEKLWKTPKFKWLLAYLLARKGQRVHEEVLMGEFWPDSAGARTNLYAAATHIRKALRFQGAVGEFVLREHEHVFFDPAVPYWHDLDQFDEALRQGDFASLVQASHLLAGPYLQGCYLDWAQRRRAQLDQAALELYLKLAGLTLEQRPQECLDYAARGLELDSLSQECHLLRMHAYLALNQPENALKQFTLCEKELRRELGIEPRTTLVEARLRARLALP